MMIISRLIFLFFLTFSSAFGQKQNLILTSEQNNKWLDSLKILPLDKQLITLKERLIADINIFIRKNYPDGIKVVEQLGDRVYGEAKPLLIVRGYLLNIDNQTETKKILTLVELLTKDYIKEIFVLRGDNPAIYGTSVQSGMIVMALTKKKYLKKFKGIGL